MADPIPRDFPDLLLDELVDILEAESAWQAAAVQYKVRRNRMLPPSKSMLPLVNVWVTDVDPDDGKSSRAGGHFTVTVNFDLYTRGEEDEAGETADQAAVSRLEYLRAQVRHAIYKLANVDLGFAVGTVARVGWPRWQTFQAGERIPFPAEDIIGGRLTVEVEYEYEPADIDKASLTDITVDDSTLALWSAHFT